MIFYLADLDLVKVLQALYKYALPAGIGIGKNLSSQVDELSREECENLLMDGAETIGDCRRITIDYIHGKPIKFDYLVDKKLAYATAYDVRNGKYRFLEALITEFGQGSFSIKSKSYPSDVSFVNMEKRKDEIRQWKKVVNEIKWNKILPKN